MVNPPAVVSLKTIVSSTTTVVSLDGGAAGLVVRTPHEKNSWKNVEKDSSYPARHRVRARKETEEIRRRKLKYARVHDVEERKLFCKLNTDRQARHRVSARCAKVSIRDRDRQHDRQNVHQKREEQVPL